MVFYIKNKLISMTGDSFVTDDRGNNCFRIDGKLVSPSRKKRICDMTGKCYYRVRNKLFTFFNKSALVYDAEGKRIARVRRNAFSIKYRVQGYKDEILLQGRIFSGQMQIIRNGESIGVIRRDFSLIRDAFILETDLEEEVPFLITLVVAVDNIQDDGERD